MAVGSYINCSIHGSAMQIEQPENLESVYRWGPGISLKGVSSTSNVFHFAIPTRFKGNSSKKQSDLHIIGAWIYFSSTPFAVIRTININDGSDLLQSNTVNLSGLHAPWEINYNTPKTVCKAIDIVLHVEFVKPKPAWPPLFPDYSMYFEAAGVACVLPV